MIFNDRKQGYTPVGRYGARNNQTSWQQKQGYKENSFKKKPAKVKIISNSQRGELADEVNKFIEDKWIINLQFSTTYKTPGVVIYTVFIYYTERATDVPESNLNGFNN